MSEHVYLHCETAGERLDVYIAGEREDLTRSFVPDAHQTGQGVCGRQGLQGQLPHAPGRHR